MKEIDIEELNKQVPEIPEEFLKYCDERMPAFPIYYRRNKKDADCICGKCAYEFVYKGLPTRGQPTACPVCGMVGKFEWKKITTLHRTYEDEMLVQCTQDGGLVLRKFCVSQNTRQGWSSSNKVEEYERWFLKEKTVCRLEFSWHKGCWRKVGGKGTDTGTYLYPGYKYEIERSVFKYCDTDKLMEIAGWNGPRGKGDGVKNVLIAFANNPAIEMYAKMGMDKLVSRLIYNGGKYCLINRWSDDHKKQLKLKDKQLINRLIESKGDPDLLFVLQYEQKNGVRYTPEQEQGLKELIRSERREVSYLTKYMSLLQLYNRIEKYVKEENSYGRGYTLRRYFDYIKMREGLGYDMTNEIYVYPKNLREKHDQMTEEKRAREDETRIARKNKQFQKIEKNYEMLSKKFTYEEDGYLIRPAKNAGEIIVEGRTLHHCVGSTDTYMSRHNKGTSYILFLRKKEKKDTPYYTLEVEPDGTILQWYSKNDRRPDEDVIEPLLQRFMAQIKNKTVKKEIAG